MVAVVESFFALGIGESNLVDNFLGRSHVDKRENTCSHIVSNPDMRGRLRNHFWGLIPDSDIFQDVAQGWERDQDWGLD
jgi:hypothetical protein